MIQPHLGISGFIKKSTILFRRYQKYLPIIFFTGGFLWDSFTLTRIDRMSDNLILLGYIFLLGFTIILVNLVDNDIIKKPFILRFREWYPLVIQFFLGGLFSSYVVFYFMSAALSKNWLFIAILVILLFSNEFLEKRLTNIYLQISLYFLVCLSFFIFFIPVLTRVMNVWIFILSGIISLFFIAGILYLLLKKYNIIDMKIFHRLAIMVASIFLFINMFYFLNWIPPVPLSLKSGGIYHTVERRDEGYILKYEKPPWYNFWKKSDNPFHYAEGDTVFCFAAVFAPTELTKRIYHDWQQFNRKNKRWILTDHLGYQVIGGREGGYRGYTYKRNVRSGKWRVEVKTDDGLLLGRIGFKIETQETRIPHVTRVYK